MSVISIIFVDLNILTEEYIKSIKTPNRLFGKHKVNFLSIYFIKASPKNCSVVFPIYLIHICVTLNWTDHCSCH